MRGKYRDYLFRFKLINSMFTMRSKKKQVLNPIIVSFMIYVVHNFRLFKESAYMLLHNVSVFKNVASAISGWVSVLSQHKISRILFNTSPTPITVLFSMKKMPIFLMPRSVTFLKLGSNARAGAFYKLSFGVSHFINYTTYRVDMQN